MTLPVALVCVALIAAVCFCFWAHLRHQAMALQERSAKAVEAFAVEVRTLHDIARLTPNDLVDTMKDVRLLKDRMSADPDLADRVTRLEIGAGLQS